MKITELKTELENRTDYEYVLGKNVLNEDALTVSGLAKRTEISIALRNFHPEVNNGTEYISVDGTDNRKGYSGHGSPCKSIDEAIEEIDRLAKQYGYKDKDKQLRLSI